MNYDDALVLVEIWAVAGVLFLVGSVIIKKLPSKEKKEKEKPEDIWGEDLTHPKCDWQFEVMSNDTVLGYWEWVEHQKEENNELENKK